MTLACLNCGTPDRAARSPYLISIVAALTVLVLGVAAAAQKSHPALTARVLSMSGDAESLELNIEVSNCTAHVYLPFPEKLLIARGSGWEICRDPAMVSNPDTVCGHSAKTLTCMFKRFRPGERLKVVIEGQRTKSGLETFLLRITARLADPGCGFSLNPLDPTPIMSGDTFVMTEPFTIQ